MAYVNFYLDKPFHPGKDKEEIKSIVSSCNEAKKHYPKGILNPQATSLYLFLTPANGIRIKTRTNIKVLPEEWDFKKGKFKSSTTGSLELNHELDTLSANLRKQFARYKEDNGDLTFF
jgi:hypothetical protein